MGILCLFVFNHYCEHFTLNEMEQHTMWEEEHRFKLKFNFKLSKLVVKFYNLKHPERMRTHNLNLEDGPR